MSWIERHERALYRLVFTVWLGASALYAVTHPSARAWWTVGVIAVVIGFGAALDIIALYRSRR